VDNNKQHKYILFTLAIYGLVYASISLVNHYFFRTYALDLGLFNNALFDYAHFRPNHYSIIRTLFPNPLCDHFALITPLVSPLYWIFGSYTMLVVQIISMLFGGYGVYYYFQKKSTSEFLPLLAMIHFLSLWGIYSALSFDFHDNIIAAMMVPWFLHFYEQKKWKFATLFFVIILISKENMALWAIFIGLGMAWMYRKDKKTCLVSLGYSLFALIYFLAVVNIIMPFLFGDFPHEGYYHFKYHALGENGKEAIKTIFSRPLYSLQLLFINHSNDPFLDNIKQELHIMVLLSGGWALLFRPHYLIMLIPIYAQKLFSDDYGKWGINAQYSIEFVPILTMALFNLLNDLSKKKWVIWLAILFVLITIVSTITKIEKRTSLWYNPTLSRFYNRSHYQSPYDIKELNKKLKLVPDDAIVCASSPLVPHLSFRKKIYAYPEIFDSNYILVLKQDAAYPLSDVELAKSISDLKLNPKWSIVTEDSNLIIFKLKDY
jgi:uncharacterized membrane protein